MEVEEAIMQALLKGIGEQRARITIMDITGVKEIDVHAANALLQAASAARMLGAEVILTGISAGVAQALVEAGVDLSSVATLGTLKSAIAYALRRCQRG